MLKSHWTLDPSVIFLNHGSFGACPLPVLEYQSALRRRLESEPVKFLARDLDGMLDEARAAVARFVGADPEGLAFVPNATAGVNAVLRSLRFDRDDELLTTTHEYNACRNVLEFVAERWGAKVVVADVPFPVRSPDDVVGAVLARVTPATRFLLVDHVTSQTALVMPVEKLTAALAPRGIDVMVDGAHAPGMLSLDIRATGAAYYTGNCHKWICAPKGAALLWVRNDRRARVRPISISHGANSARTDRSPYHLEFDWTGTLDPTAMLSVPKAIEFMASLDPAGWPGVMARNRAKALEARDMLCAALSIDRPAPDEMIGSMAAVPLPDGRSDAAPSLYGDVLQDALFDRYSIEIPVIPWPGPPHRLIRASAQLYNERSEYQALCEALVVLLEEERRA